MPILDKVSVNDVVYDLSVATDKTLGVENKAADAKAVGDELTALKADLNNIDERVGVLETGDSDDTAKPISAYSAFETGGLNGTGTIYKGSKNRVVSSDIISFPREALLIAEPGYRLNVAMFDGETIQAVRGWYQYSFVVPPNISVRVCIARVTEDSSETADVDAFASKVTVKLKAEDIPAEIDSINQLELVPITKYSLFQNGDANQNAHLDRYYRVYTGNHIIHFSADTTFITASGFNLTAYYFIDGAYSSTSGQQFGRFTVPANSDAKLTIRRNTEVTSEIADIDEFTSAVSVETPLYKAGKQANRLSDVKSLKPDTILDYGTFTNGVLANGAISKTQLYRICTVEPFAVDYDMTLHIAEGFYVNVSYFEDGAYVRNSTDVQVQYTIPAGSTVGIMISRVTSDTTERASIDEFTSKVIVPTKLETKLNSLSNVESAFNYANSLSTTTIASFGSFGNGRMLYGMLDRKHNVNRVSSEDIVVFGYDVTIYIAANFIGQVWYFENGVYTTNTGWIQGSIAIPAGTEVKFEIRRQSEVTSEVADIDEFTAQLTVVSALTAKLTESTQYHADGDALDVKRHGYDVEQLFACPPKRQQGWPQGMAIHNGIIAQFCSAPDDSMHLIDLSDGTVIATLTDTHSGHGNTAVFSDEYYDANDEFPLCYVSTGTVCNVVRIERTGVTLIRSINTDDIEHSGYQVSYTIDKATNTLWGIGYYVNNWQQRDGNHMLFSQWDLSNMTEVESGVFKPAYIGGFTMPYIGGAVQGIRFFNNRLWICQQDTAEDPQVYTNIFVMDTDKHRYVSTMSEFPNPVRNYESESIEFVLNSAGDRYDMILLTTEHYYRVAFN